MNDKKLLQAIGYRDCPHCGVTKPLNEFSVNGYKNGKPYYSICKLCRNEKRHTRYHSDENYREKQKEANRKYLSKLVETEEHKKARLEKKRIYYQNNLASLKGSNQNGNSNE